uniref:Putative type II intron maturase n=1 Tax=Ostreobium quekettii TaxID=121088 RepID=A0A650BXA2_9CHLO|nr:putative type II intron maturase [Ostreobium quekettii]QGQ61974.1 putative type II intron maturase [Ostreobium quekettii]
MVVQEVIRMVLESIYETQRFAQARSAHSYLHTHTFGRSFRPNRFFALKEIRNTWNRVSWLMKFDIKQSFDRIYIRRFILLLKDKIHDQRFFDLIQKMLNSALSVHTMSGERQSLEEIVPVLSPLLSNIYMHSLDSEALEVKKDYETPSAASAVSKRTKRAAPADPRIYDRRLNQKFRNTIKVTSVERRRLNDDYERIVALKVGRERIARRRGLTRKNYRDEEFIQVKYIRDANDFLFGIAGSRQLVETIGHRILHFLKVNMELEVTLYNYVHVTGGRVEFLGVYIYSVPALKWPTKLDKSVEKRRRIRNRLNIFAKQRKEALAHKLHQSVLDAWAWGFKKSKNISGLEAAKQAMYAKAATFDIGKIETSDPLKQLLKEEKDFFSRTAWREFPEEVKKAYYKLFEVLQRQVHQYNLEDPRRGTAPPLSDACIAYGVYRHPPLRLVVPLDQLMKKLRSQGVITQRKSRPSVVGSILYLPDDLIVHWFSSLAYDILNNYRCCDNFYMVKNLVDYQIRWSAIFTLTAKHKSTTHKTIKTYTKDLRITNQYGTELASFPSGSMIKALNKTLQGRAGLGFTS